MMALSGFSRKKKAAAPCACETGQNISDVENARAAETQAPACCRGGQGTISITEEETTDIAAISLQVLGSGCAKCSRPGASAAEALKELGLDPAIEPVSDFSRIASYGVMSTAALVLNGTLLSSGRVLKKQKILKLLQTAREQHPESTRFPLSPQCIAEGGGSA